MSAYNDITGEPIQSKALSKQGRENWDNIFKKKIHETDTEHTDPDDTGTRKKTAIPTIEDRGADRRASRRAPDPE
jgi:hypothetical protein